MSHYIMNSLIDDLFEHFADARPNRTARNSLVDTGSVFSSKRTSMLNFESKRGSQTLRTSVMENRPFQVDHCSRTSLLVLPDLPNHNEDLEFGIRFFYPAEQSIMKPHIESLICMQPTESDKNHVRCEQNTFEQANNFPSHSSTKSKRKRQPRRKLQHQQDQPSCCNCKKTKCLKLYCECFANGGTCGPKCKCYDCHNVEELQDLRDLIIQETLEKNPLAFKSKYKKVEVETVAEQLHTRGCNCKKTGCQKNYCECYTAGIGCSPLCKCSDCKNDKIDTLKQEEIVKHHEKVLRKRKKPNYLYDFYFNKYSSVKRVH